MLKQIPSLFNLKSYKSVYGLVSSYIENEKLRRLLSMHPLLVGGNPFTTTSIYGLILYLEKKWGIHYSMGGTGNIIKGFEKLMNEEVNFNEKNTDLINKIYEYDDIQTNQTVLIPSNHESNTEPRTIQAQEIVAQESLSLQEKEIEMIKNALEKHRGKRKGALCAYLESFHIDVEDFLQLRKNHGNESERARDLFLACWISDLFMERVKEGGDWTLMCPDECPGLADCYGDEFKELYCKS